MSSKVSRYVALLTPLFAAAAGYVATQATKLPGAPVLDSTQLTVVFVGGATAAAAAAIKWLQGRAAWERAELAHSHELQRAMWYSDGDEPIVFNKVEGGDDPEIFESILSLSWPDAVEKLRGHLALPDIERDAARALSAFAALGEEIGRLADRLEEVEARARHVNIPERPHVDHHPV